MLKGYLKLDAAFNTSSQNSLVSKQRVDELTECFNTKIASASKSYNEAKADHTLAIEAVKEIHDDKLYLAYCDSWGQFCTLKLHKSASYVHRMLRQLAIDRAVDKNSQSVNLVHNLPLIENDLQNENPEIKEVNVMNEPTLPAPKPRPGKEPVSVSERIEAIRYNDRLTEEEKWDLLVSIDWSRFKLTP